MLIEQCKVGDRVKWQETEALVVCVIGGSYLLGWREKDPRPQFAWLASVCLSGAGEAALRAHKCDYGYWVMPGDQVELVTHTCSLTADNCAGLSAPARVGMKCVGQYCPEPYNQWAEANQPDGTYMCYSCRQPH